ncbi:hypothetical protein VNO78_34697 [Psophocarpus tetragonolobus]|uniref:Uncharacterized protein n=1 Tax=Psophocarpus tetragonolobus TaxID=3891 RepID=A0AAN9NNI6_PSOTE
MADSLFDFPEVVTDIEPNGNICPNSPKHTLTQGESSEAYAQSVVEVTHAGWVMEFRVGNVGVFHIGSGVIHEGVMEDHAGVLVDHHEILEESQAV